MSGVFSGPPFAIPGPGPAPGVTSVNGQSGAVSLATTNLTDVTPRTAWTPTITCTTPGDLSVSYTSQIGWWSKIGNIYFWYFSLGGTPTYTTATGALFVSGYPNPTTANTIGSGSLVQFYLNAATWQASANQVVPLWTTGNNVQFGGLKPQSNTNVFQITATAPSGLVALIAAAGFYMV